MNNDLMSNGGDCRTALAIRGLLNYNLYVFSRTCLSWDLHDNIFKGTWFRVCFQSHLVLKYFHRHFLDMLSEVRLFFVLFCLNFSRERAILVKFVSPFYCTRLHSTVLHYTKLLCTALHCSALHCNAPHCTTPHRTAPHRATLHCAKLHCNALHYTTLYCIALQCTAMQCDVLNCTALRCISVVVLEFLAKL